MQKLLNWCGLTLLGLILILSNQSSMAAPGVVVVSASARLLHCEPFQSEEIGSYPQQSIWRGLKSPPRSVRLGMLEIVENPRLEFANSVPEADKAKYAIPIRWRVGQKFIALLTFSSEDVCDGPMPRTVRISTFAREEQAGAILGLSSVAVLPE